MHGAQGADLALAGWQPETRRGMMVRGLNASNRRYERRAMSDSDHEHWTIAAADSHGKPLIRYHIDANREILFTQSLGVLTLGSLAAYGQALGFEAKFDPSFDNLFDLTTVEKIDMSARDAAEAAAAFSRMPERRTGKLALVSGPDAGRRQFLRMYLAHYQHLTKRRAAVFDSVEEAMTWLQE